MHPILFSIGPLTVHTYGLMAALGFAAAMIVTVRYSEREGLTRDQVMDMGFIMVLAAILGARLLYVIIKLPYYLEHPLDIIKLWHGGLVFSGGVIGVMIAVYFYVKRHHLSFLKVGDLWAPGVALGQAIGRVGCFMAGCCYGKPTRSILGVTFKDPNSLAPTGIPLHPTQLYHSVSCLVIFIVLLILRSKKKFDGQVVTWFFILHSTARLAIERFRGDFRGMVPGTDMTVTQLVSLLLLISSVVMLFVLKQREN